MPRTIERRAFQANLEVRETDGGITVVRGYAAVFDSPSHNEVVRRSAFQKTLAERDDVRLLVNHDGVPLARSTSGTLQLGVDERGLWVEADLDPTNPSAQELISAMQRGDIDQMSFAFVDFTPKEERVDGDGLRNIRQVQLYDVSIVTFPWYEDTNAELNHLALVAAEARSAGTAPGHADAKRIALLLPDLNKRSLNGWTFADLRPLLWDAVADAIGESYWWLYICDISDEWLVYCVEGVDGDACFQVPYTVTSEGAVVLGEGTAVIAKTTYITDPDAAEDERELEAASASAMEAIKAQVRRRRAVEPKPHRAA